MLGDLAAKCVRVPLSVSTANDHVQLPRHEIGWHYLLGFDVNKVKCFC